MTRARWERCAHFRKLGVRNIAQSWARMHLPKQESELREEGTRLIGSVGYFPERYGEDLIHLSLDILNQRQVAPAMFVQHKLITAQNVDHYYPNDGLQKMVTCPSAGAVPAHP